MRDREEGLIKIAAKPQEGLDAGEGAAELARRVMLKRAPQYEDLFDGPFKDRRDEGGAVADQWNEKWAGIEQRKCDDCGTIAVWYSNTSDSEGALCYLICENYHRWMARGRR